MRLGTQDNKTLKNALYSVRKYIHVSAKDSLDRWYLTPVVGSRIRPGVRQLRWGIRLGQCDIFYTRELPGGEFGLAIATMQTHAFKQYALLAMQNLMELDYGWATLNDSFILRIVSILSDPQSPINVCRPATAILRKLVEADPMSAPGPQASSSKSSPVPPPGSVYRYGFAMVFGQMRKEKTLLDTVVHRLGSGDTVMVQHR